MYSSVIRCRASRIAVGDATASIVDRIAARHASHDLLLFVARRIADAQLEHEAVDLRFGERIGALLLDRILRREHEERLLELERRAADRHLLFLHRLEQRGLHLRRRAVDLVGEDDVREDRPPLHGELARRLVVDLRAEHVGRQQIGRELNAMERRVDRLGERADGQRLRQTGHALEQNVSAGEKTDEQSVNHVFLTDDAPRDLARDILYQPRIRRRR